MAENKKIQMQSFGGLIRYDDEYQSRFTITPKQVIAFVVAIIIFVILLNIFF